MKKRLFSALCAVSLVLSLSGTALASTYSVTLTAEEAAGEIPVLLTIPAITPAAPGQEADRIVLSAPTAGAAVEIPINGKASDADLLLVDEQGLYEAAEDTVRGESGVSFADVPGGKYYSAAVSWAAGEGIVTGSGSGNFNPTGKLTREQLAVVLYRYAQYEGRDVSRRADLGAYKDGAKVSSWAKDAMSWAVAEGLITGSNQKNLTPGGSTNRAQLAAILMRYCA